MRKKQYLLCCCRIKENKEQFKAGFIPGLFLLIKLTYELCARHHFTQIELARLVGVTRQTIGFIEKGEFSPSVTLSLKLACALDCDINELFWLEGDIP